MQALTPEIIDCFQENDLEMLSKLDAAGFLLKPQETLPEFKIRLKAHLAALDEFNCTIKDSGEFRLFDDFTLYEKNRIGDGIIQEASAVTDRLYQFSINWAPGFFLHKSIELLWGGCAIHLPEEHFTVFLIRKNFASARRWFIYRREELLAHELCHAARSPLRDCEFEEFFAYQTAPSRIRRYLGNCFRKQRDALFFVLPIMLLLVAQMVETFAGYNLPIGIFWVAALAYPIFLLFRNQLSRSHLFRARQALSTQPGAMPLPALFRCTGQEIRELAARRGDAAGVAEYIRSHAAAELRWQVLCHRFMLCTVKNST